MTTVAWPDAERRPWFVVYLYTDESAESEAFATWTNGLDEDAKAAMLSLQLRELPMPGSGRWRLQGHPAESALLVGLHVSRCKAKPAEGEWIERKLKDALAGELVDDHEAIIWEFARRGLAWEESSGGAGSHHYLQVVGGLEAGR